MARSTPCPGWTPDVPHRRTEDSGGPPIIMPSASSASPRRRGGTNGDVEAVVSQLRQGEQVIEIGADEAGGDAQLPTQRPCGRDRLRREIGARDARAAPGPGEGVQAEVALQMEEDLPPDVAELVYLDGLEPGLPRLEAGDVVVRRSHVCLRPGVPQGAVRAHMGRVGCGCVWLWLAAAGDGPVMAVVVLVAQVCHVCHLVPIGL